MTVNIQKHGSIVTYLNVPTGSEFDPIDDLMFIPLSINASPDSLTINNNLSNATEFKFDLSPWTLSKGFFIEMLVLKHMREKFPTYNFNILPDY